MLTLVQTETVQKYKTGQNTLATAKVLLYPDRLKVRECITVVNHVLGDNMEAHTNPLFNCSNPRDARDVLKPSLGTARSDL